MLRLVAPVQETFTEALEFTSEFTARAWPNLIKHFNPAWIEEALVSTGTATIRRRRLPAERTVWLVLGMAVMRDLPITAVARQLDIALPAEDGSRTVAGSALSQARARLGPDPMEWLYLRTAEEWAHRSAGADRWRGLALYGTDGTTLRVADSVENRDHFGGPKTGPHAGGHDERESGYPLMKLVVVMALRSHLLACAAFGPYAVDERVYAASLWDTVPDQSLVLIDRNYLQASVLVPLTSKGVGRHWLTRAKSNTKFRLIRRLGNGDELDVPPLRISFVAALREVVEQWHLATIVSPGTIPARLSTVADRLRQFLLPPRRPDRAFPRAVKIKMSSYTRKPPTKSSSRKRAK